MSGFSGPSHKRKKAGKAKLKTKDGVEIQEITKTRESLQELNVSEEDIDNLLKSNMIVVKLLADPEDEGISIERNGEIIEITVERQKYKPINVFRTLLKIALSLIPQSEFHNYKNMVEILNDDNHSLAPEMLKIYEGNLPKYNSYFKDATVLHFNKIDEKENLPQKYFVLYMDNKIIQIPLFSDADVQRFIIEKEIYIDYTVPPHLNPIALFNDRPNLAFHLDLVRLPFNKIDLDSINEIRGEKHSIKLTKDTAPKLIEKDNRILKKMIINEPLEADKWGFKIVPEYQENLVDVKIIFDFHAPISEKQHTYLRSGHHFQISNISKDEFENNISGIEDLILLSMTHTHKMYKQEFPEYEHVELKLFHKRYFQSQIIEQLKELNKDE